MDKIGMVKRELMDRVKHDKIEDVQINGRNNVVFKTKWMRFECFLKEKNGKVSCRIGDGAHPALLAGAVLGVVVLLPTVVAIGIVALDMKVKKEIKIQIEHILMEMNAA